MGDKRYPLGIQSFPKIIEGNYHYVDKTDLVYKLANYDAPYVFLSRPSGFGKSLLLSTLKTYFEGKKEYFKAFSIDELESEWRSYPILHMDFSKVTSDDPKCIQEGFNALLDELYKAYGFEVQEISLGLKLRKLIKQLYKKFSQQVVILIDAYDTPILNVFASEEKLAAVRQSMSELFAPIKSLDVYLRFMCITGRTKLPLASIDGVLNNFYSISLRSKFSSICGISEDELRSVFASDIEKLACTLNLSPEDTVSELRSWYGGYHFCWPSQEMYRPTSVLRCFAEDSLSPWQSEPETSNRVIKAFKKSSIDLSKGTEATILAFPEMFDVVLKSNPEPLALLYQAGYLTIKQEDPSGRFLELGIPNREMFASLTSGLDSL